MGIRFRLLRKLFFEVNSPFQDGSAFNLHIDGRMTPLDLVRLAPLMQQTDGRPEVIIGLVDGPVDSNHAALIGQRLREIPQRGNSGCSHIHSAACLHGTFVAGILCAKRSSPAPAICPGCTLLIRTVFSEKNTENERIPSASSEELAAAILECIEAGARCVNLSLAVPHQSAEGERELKQILDLAARRGVVIIAAAGNQGNVGGTVITRHPWVVPVVACDRLGIPTAESNLGGSIGQQGLCAPGDAITSLAPGNGSRILGGTSIATAFVTGAIALLWSQFPEATAAEIKFAVTKGLFPRRRTVVPPLLDAWAAHEFLQSTRSRN